jgi:hypothetical protein
MAVLPDAVETPDSDHNTLASGFYGLGADLAADALPDTDDEFQTNLWRSESSETIVSMFYAAVAPDSSVLPYDTSDTTSAAATNQRRGKIIKVGGGRVQIGLPLFCNFVSWFLFVPCTALTRLFQCHIYPRVPRLDREAGWLSSKLLRARHKRNIIGSDAKSNATSSSSSSDETAAAGDDDTRRAAKAGGDAAGGVGSLASSRLPQSTASSRWFMGNSNKGDSFPAPAQLLASRGGWNTGCSDESSRGDTGRSDNSGLVATATSRGLSHGAEDAATVIMRARALNETGTMITTAADSAPEHTGAAHPLLGNAGTPSPRGDSYNADSPGPGSSRWSQILAEEEHNKELYEAAKVTGNAAVAAAGEEEAYDMPQRAVPRGWLDKAKPPSAAASQDSSRPTSASALRRGEGPLHSGSRPAHIPPPPKALPAAASALVLARKGESVSRPSSAQRGLQQRDNVEEDEYDVPQNAISSARGSGKGKGKGKVWPPEGQQSRLTEQLARQARLAAMAAPPVPARSSLGEAPPSPSFSAPSRPLPTPPPP